MEAKRQLALGNYSAAKQSFKNLTTDPVFGAYASFYYAWSALKQGNDQQAYDMLRQTQLNFPKWDQNQEVGYWLGHTAFSLKKYKEGFNHIENLPADLKESLIERVFSALPIQELKKAYDLNPDNKYVASYLIKALKDQPYNSRDHQMLSSLSDKFDIEISYVGGELPLIKKQKYSIAVVLPFMFEALNDPQSVIRNSIIFDLYQGMLLAQQHLKKEDINLEIFPFDTRKSGARTQEIISSGKLKKADVIVGPLYAEPARVISDYSKDNKITMMNPLSSNDALIRDNPYSFLFQPTYVTQGRMAAKYAANTFKDNKRAYILYETTRDSLVASAYKAEIEAEGFLVVRYGRMNSEIARKIQSDFTEQYEVRLDTGYKKEQVDSINLIPGRYVRSRPMRSRSDGSIIRNDEGEEITEYYENKFHIKLNSIGHMFVATESNLLANNFISLGEVRTDTIGIIGYEEWLDFSTLSFDQLERLKIAFINPSYFKTDQTYALLKADFIKSVGREPGEYHLTGYELIYQLGHLLKKNGKYFQRGLRTGEFFPGKVMEGMQYGAFNDNQVVPITKLEDLRLVNQMTEKEEGKR